MWSPEPETPAGVGLNSRTSALFHAFALAGSAFAQSSWEYPPAVHPPDWEVVRQGTWHAQGRTQHGTFVKEDPPLLRLAFGQNWLCICSARTVSILTDINSAIYQSSDEY